MESAVTTPEELLETSVPPQMRDLDPTRTRRAIVTGGSTGIGRYTAVALAKDGCDVAFTYAHNEDDAQVTAEAIGRLGRQAFPVRMDLTEPEHAEPAIDEMVDLLGGLDIYVNNAGTMVQQRLPDIDLAEMQRLFNINTFGAVLGTQRAVRHMLQMKADPSEEGTIERAAHTARWLVSGQEVSAKPTPGRIILITSTHEYIASPVDHVYTMTKHALGGFVKCAALEMADYNITVNAVAPGEVATPINQMGPEDSLKQSRGGYPSGRPGHPSEIAETVRFIASDRSFFVNGTSVAVDGGLEIATPLAMKAYRAAV